MAYPRPKEALRPAAPLRASRGNGRVAYGVALALAVVSGWATALIMLIMFIH